MWFQGGIPGGLWRATSLELVQSKAWHWSSRTCFPIKSKIWLQFLSLLHTLLTIWQFLTPPCRNAEENKIMQDHNHTVEWEFECLRPRTSSGRGWRQTRPSGSGSDVPFEWLRHRRGVRSEISLLSVTINYRIPKKYFMLVNLVSINRIEKVFQSLPRCAENKFFAELMVCMNDSRNAG